MVLILFDELLQLAVFLIKFVLEYVSGTRQIILRVVLGLDSDWISSLISGGAFIR